MGWLIDAKERLVQVFDGDRRIISIEQEGDRLPTANFAQSLNLSLGTLWNWLKLV